MNQSSLTGSQCGHCGLRNKEDVPPTTPCDEGRVLRSTLPHCEEAIEARLEQCSAADEQLCFSLEMRRRDLRTKAMVLGARYVLHLSSNSPADCAVRRPEATILHSVFGNRRDRVESVRACVDGWITPLSDAREGIAQMLDCVASKAPWFALEAVEHCVVELLEMGEAMVGQLQDALNILKKPGLITAMFDDDPVAGALTPDDATAGSKANDSTLQPTSSSLSSRGKACFDLAEARLRTRKFAREANARLEAQQTHQQVDTPCPPTTDTKPLRSTRVLSPAVVAAMERRQRRLSQPLARRKVLTCGDKTTLKTLSLVEKCLKREA